MAYGEGSENARMLLRTIRLTFDISGRSRRTEFVYWWIATTLAGMVIGFIFVPFLSWKAALVSNELLRFVPLIPTFALFARRLHDQDRSGWWALLLPAATVLALPDAINWITDSPTELLAYENSGIHPGRWAAGLATLATLVLMLMPPTPGPNNYGPDPRQIGEGKPSFKIEDR